MMISKTKLKFAIRFLAILLNISFLLCLIPDFSVKADEPAEVIAVNDTITKTKSAKKVNLKGSISKAYLKKDIIVNKLNVTVKNAEIYAGTGVTINNLYCNKKNSYVILEALAGDVITVNLKKKTTLTVKGSSKSNITVNVLCKGCRIISEIPVKIISEYPVDFVSPANESLAGNEKIYDLKWWIDNYADDTVILTDGEIGLFNNANFHNGCGLVDLSAFENDLTTEKIIGMINDYSFPSKEYVNGRKITDEEKNEILLNRNIPDVNTEGTIETVNEDLNLNIRYAVTTENASIRAFPTDIFLTNTVGKYDYMQETGVNYYEPLIVLWNSKDGEWSFVQTYDYNGWMRKDSFGLCSKEIFDSLVNDIKNGDYQVFNKTGRFFLDINTTGTMFALEEYVEPEDANADNIADIENLLVTFRMGTQIPYKDGKFTWVFRNEKGEAEFMSLERIYTGMVNDSFIADYILPVQKFTKNNLLYRANEALGTPYSWGDSDENGMDCSSTLQGLFKCFGIIIPRNSSQQIKLSANIVNLSEMSLTEKLDTITDLPMGSILYMPGHVMMYLGEYNGIPYIIHNTTDSARDDNGVTYFNSCVLTSIGIGKSGLTLFDKITYAVTFK